MSFTAPEIRAAAGEVLKNGIPLKGKFWVIGKVQRGIGCRMRKTQPDGIEPEAVRGRESGLKRGRRIFDISCNWTAHVGHLDADLVVAPGIKGDLGNRKAAVGTKNFIMKPCRLCPQGVRRADTGRIRPSVFDHIVLQGIFRPDRDSV